MTGIESITCITEAAPHRIAAYRVERDGIEFRPIVYVAGVKTHALGPIRANAKLVEFVDTRAGLKAAPSIPGFAVSFAYDGDLPDDPCAAKKFIVRLGILEE